MASETLIHLIATFDHNSGTTACGQELDTWTIKYPDLTGALQYGYAKGSCLELFEVNCEKCRKSLDWFNDAATYSQYINTDILKFQQTISRLISRIPELKEKLLKDQESFLQRLEKDKEEYEKLGLQDNIERSS